MFRTLLSAVIGAATWYEFLGWARKETEGQISKMQDAAFNTPGAEAPVPTSVVLAVFGVISGHFALCRIFRLSRLQSIVSLLLAFAFAAVLLLRPRRVY